MLPENTTPFESKGRGNAEKQMLISCHRQLLAILHDLPADPGNLLPQHFSHGTRRSS